jgi:hypothetical protein
MSTDNPDSPGTPVAEPTSRDAPPEQPRTYRVEQPGYVGPTDIADDDVPLRSGGRAVRKQASAEPPEAQ